MGDVISFVGTYRASRGQAAAVTFYTFVGAWRAALRSTWQRFLMRRVGQNHANILIYSSRRARHHSLTGMASVALVMSLLVPQIGNWWYSLTLLAPGAWVYYFREGTRQEEVRHRGPRTSAHLRTGGAFGALVQSSVCVLLLPSSSCPIPAVGRPPHHARPHRA